MASKSSVKSSSTPFFSATVTGEGIWALLMRLFVVFTGDLRFGPFSSAWWVLLFSFIGVFGLKSVCFDTVPLVVGSFFCSLCLLSIAVVSGISVEYEPSELFPRIWPLSNDFFGVFNGVCCALEHFGIGTSKQINAWNFSVSATHV